MFQRVLTGLNAPFLILETGQPVASMRRHGGFPHWIRVAAGLDRDAAVVVNVEGGDAAAAASGLRRRDRSPAPARWSPSAATGANAARSWLRDAAHAGMPLFGICYGHQLLAHALGGEVGYNPARPRDGHGRPRAASARRSTIRCSPACRRSSRRRPRTCRRCCARPQARRCWRVRRRTPATRSAGASGVGRAVPSGIQHHAHARLRPARKHEALAREGRCSRSGLAREVSAAPHARRVLRRFVRHARAIGRHRLRSTTAAGERNA